MPTRATEGARKSNRTLQQTKIPYVTEVVHERSSRQHDKLEEHANQLLETLLRPLNNKRLKILRPLDF